uniref:FGFR1 oncogene partner (FOP) N-terminal dimerisation domain-containing protein n=1 Tax=Tetraodon nigroviridis TaxID=99883 RepID=H3C715_TETNG
MSAAEDDTELRDLLVQSLEKSGIMNKLKAEMRAAVFLAMEEQDKLEKRTPVINENLKRCLSTEDGQLVVSLILDFLQVFHLDFTLSVFRPEINSGNGLDGRDAVCRQLRLSPSEGSRSSPLLLELIRRIRQEANQDVLRSEVGSEEQSGSAGPSKVLSCPDQSGGGAAAAARPEQHQELDLQEDHQDSFFDDPLPKAQKTYGWRAETSQSRTSPAGSLSERQRPAAGGGAASGHQDSRETSCRDPESAAHTGSSHLGDFEYGDDFNSHRSILSRSDGSIGEEIEEVSIEGPELSDKFEGSTEDVSVSQLSQAHGAAYMEDVS